MKTGDTIENSGGVNATDIPVGAVVSYSNGICGSSTTTVVRMQDGKKVLGIPGSDLFYHGQDGKMLITLLPTDPEPKITEWDIDRERFENERADWERR